MSIWAYTECMRRVFKFLIGVAVLAAVIVVVRPRPFYFLIPSGHAVTLAQSGKDVSISGRYPEFGRSTVDTHIRSLVFDAVVQSGLDEAQSHEHASGETDSYIVSYDIPVRTLRYAGVVLHVAVSTGAFKGEYVIVRTYDLIKDRLVGLDDVTVPGGDRTQAVLSEIMAQLQTRSDITPASLGRLGAHRSTFENLLVRRDGVTFYFNPGDVSPREKGIITVVIPWTQSDTFHQP